MDVPLGDTVGKPISRRFAVLILIVMDVPLGGE